MRHCSCFLILLFLVLGVGCTSKRPAPSGPAKHYQLTGTVVSTDAKDQSASIDAAAIPNYMEAMKMDYPIRDKQEFEQLKPGEKISGTLDVFESGDFTLHDIKPAAGMR